MGRRRMGEEGLEISGEKLTHLLYADDVVLIAQDMDKLQGMLDKVRDACLEVGLKINKGKTKTMCNGFVTDKKCVQLEDDEIEMVDGFVYLGQDMTMNNDFNREISRRIKASWAAYSRLRGIIREKSIPMCLRRKVANQCIIPVASYASETWALTKKLEDRIVKMQRHMERSMLGITLRDKWTVEKIRETTGVTDIMETAKRSKWRWSGHVARSGGQRWVVKTTQWRPDRKRALGRPKRRWEDEIRTCDGEWWSTAQDRSSWKEVGEAFIQQWIDKKG